MRKTIDFTSWCVFMQFFTSIVWKAT